MSEKERLEKCFIPPYLQQFSDIENLCEQVKAAVQEYYWKTGLKVEWLGFAFGDEVTVKVIHEEYDHQTNDRLFLKAGEAKPIVATAKK
jgi:hypothetical protein